jgi:hypothetical protein
MRVFERVLARYVELYLSLLVEIFTKLKTIVHIRWFIVMNIEFEAAASGIIFDSFPSDAFLPE